MNEAPPRGMSIASFAFGIVSLLCGFTLVVPLTGLILGAVARGKEPEGKTFSGWGIALNLFALIGWIVISVILFATGVIGAFIHPQM